MNVRVERWPQVVLCPSCASDIVPHSPQLETAPHVG
jgi:hypothetical protein